MSLNLLEQSLGQLACDIAGATRIFHTFKLDFCCGGHKSLREAALSKELDPVVIAEALHILQDTGETQYDWRHEPSQELIRLARRVEHVHGVRPTCPNGLADLLNDLQQELESHMLKEEQVLFPML